MIEKITSNDPKFLLDSEKYHRIWKTYKESRKCDYINRVGFYRYGIAYEADIVLQNMKSSGGLTDSQLKLLEYELTKIDPRSKNKPESVSEHSLGTIELVMGISRFFPNKIPQSELYRYIRLLKYHDVAEKDVGDIADDGTRDEDDKNRREYESTKAFVIDWPENEKEHFLRDYKAFQEPYNDKLSLDERKFVQICYLCDKTDAILKAIVYEIYGQFGGLNPLTSSPVDRKEVERIGTDNAVDCWTYRYFEKEWARPSYCREIFIGIIKAAILDVRGEWFSWANKFGF